MLRRFTIAGVGIAVLLLCAVRPVDAQVAAGWYNLSDGAPIQGGTLTMIGQQVNLTGGTLQTVGVSGGYSTTNLSGGVLRASTGVATAFQSGLTEAYIYPGGGLTKIGAGTLTLSGTNSYTGGTSVAAGILQLGSAGALSLTAANTYSSGTLTILGTATPLTLSGAAAGATLSATGAIAGITITNPGQGYLSADTLTATLSGGVAGLVKLGSGMLTLSTANTYPGGTLVLGVDNALPTTTPLTLGATASFAAVDLSGHYETVSGLAGNAGTITSVRGVSGGTATLDVAGGTGSSTFGGTIEGATDLLVSSGTLTLTGSNVYTGGTSVGGGLLEITSAAALPAGTSLTIGSDAGVVFDAGIRPGPVAGGDGTGNANVLGPTGQSFTPPVASGGADVAAVPEPDTLALLAAAAVAGLAVAAPPRKRDAASSTRRCQG
jgi:autotransporter-associated beta strand protein